MNTQQALKIKDIMERAENHTGITKRVFKTLTQEIEKLGLRPEECKMQVRRLGQKLGV